MIKTTLLYPERSLPLVIEADSSNGAASDPNLLISWYRENEQFVEQKLLEHGAILFRGFNVSAPASFARFTRAAASDLLDWMEENVPRTKLTSGIYTST